MAGTDAIPEEVMEVLKRAGTGGVSDALAMAGLEGSIPDIRPTRGFEDTCIVGQAATAYWAPARPDTPPHNLFNAIEVAAAGSVLVIDGKGLHQRFGGDRLGEFAKRRGVAGFVVYGCTRDVAGFRQIGMPLFSLGGSTKAKPANFRVAGINVPVEVGGVVVKAGDIIVGDEDGVVAIPRDALETVMENLKTVEEVERGVTEAIARGASAQEINEVAKKKTPKR